MLLNRNTSKRQQNKKKTDEDQQQHGKIPNNGIPQIFHGPIHSNNEEQKKPKRPERTWRNRHTDQKKRR